MPAVLTEAMVLEQQKLVYGAYRLQNGEHIICTAPISDAELAIYKRSPETFFGVVKHVGAQLNEPMDYYDFLHETYPQTPRDKLLEFVANWPDYAFLSTLDQKKLAQHYCARIAESMLADRARRKTQRPTAA